MGQDFIPIAVDEAPSNQLIFLEPFRLCLLFYADFVKVVRNLDDLVV